METVLTQQRILSIQRSSLQLKQEAQTNETSMVLL